MNIKFGKSDASFLTALLLCLVIFYPELFLARAGSLSADHMWQHYPWAKLLWESVRAFRLPFWTPLIQCGFPIAAESQIGIFYPVNLLLYFLLPLEWAHSYMNVFHFILSGGAVYLYARQIGLKPVGSFISAFLFLFGASYGGAYYNLTSLKTIAWFPLELFLFEKAYQGRKRRYFVYLSLIIAVTLIAGYMQVGVMCLFMLAMYALLRIFIFHEHGRNAAAFNFKICLALAASAAFGMILASPQIWLTYRMALLSNRAGVVEEYAYVGSMFPAAVATVFFPHWSSSFRGNNLYMGIFTLILVFAAFDRSDGAARKRLKLWLSMGFIALFMALGQWSPLYVAFVKSTHFYSFRTPAKFLIFICFSMSLLGGLGFQRLWEGAADSVRAGRRFLGFCFFFLCSAGLIYVLFRYGHREVLKAGDWFVNAFIYGKAGHPHSLDMYRDKLAKHAEQVLGYFSMSPEVFWNFVMILGGIFFSIWLIKMKKPARAWLAAGFVFLFLDLYSFTYSAVKKNFLDYRSVELNSPVVQYLLNEHKSGAISRVYGFNYQWKFVPIPPNRNMLYGYADIGAYSPLVMKRYYETVGQLGGVDDSNFPYWPEPAFVLDHLNILKLTGVSHVLSLYPFAHEDLELLAQDPQHHLFLYRFKPVQTKAFFVSRVKTVKNWGEAKNEIMDPSFNPFSALMLEPSEVEKVNVTAPELMSISKNSGKNEVVCERAEPEFERWRVRAEHPGFFVLENSYYPGWRARVNGKKVNILRAYGLFQAVPIAESGTYLIEFQFFPFD